MTCQPGIGCTGAHHPDHRGHDQWHLISSPGFVWCRTCQVDFKMRVKASVEDEHQHRWSKSFFQAGIETQWCLGEECHARRALTDEGKWIRTDSEWHNQ